MDTQRPTAAAASAWRHLPPGVWALGFGSMAMDISSELIHAVLPLFMVTVLGASMATVGVVEGVAEATASIVKVFSGALSDRWRRRKPVMLAGYALSALTKPLFPLAGAIGWVMAARFADRVGKGIRGAPRDALVADITPGDRRGAAFGLRQGLDSAGAVLGPVLALALLAAWGERLQAVMWVAVVPAVLAVLLLWRFVPEPARAGGEGGGARAAGLRWSDARRLPAAFWGVVGLGAVFTLARFSEAFLVLRAQDVGLPLALAPMVMVAMNAVYALGAYPAGRLADRWPARRLLALGLLALVAADALLAAARGPVVVMMGALLWGLHMALTQGLLSKLVADAAPADLRGSAFGLFNLATGVALLAASTLAGLLWSAHGAPATFVAGAAFAALAALSLRWVAPAKGNP